MISNIFSANRAGSYISEAISSIGKMGDKAVHFFCKPQEQTYALIFKNVVAPHINIAKGIVIGAAVIRPLTSGIIKLADVVNLLPKHTYKCLNQEEYLNTMIVTTHVAILEECIFRNGIQEVIFTKLPKFIAKKMQPGKENIFDTKAAKVTRIAITSLLFSAYHYLNAFSIRGLNNSPIGIDAAIRQMFFTFFLGVGCGILKESKKFDLEGAIGGHLGFNIASYTLQRLGLLHLF